VTSELGGACRGRAVSWPLFQIDLAGEPKLLGRLHRLAQDQYWFDEPLAACGPLSDGLPFFLHDLIPQGFLGRGLPRRFSDLALPPDIADWDDKHVLTYLCRRGEDSIGNLVLGDESLQRFSRGCAQKLLTAAKATIRCWRTGHTRFRVLPPAVSIPNSRL